MHIGAHALANNLFVAPMAGVTDRPFRQLCRRLGAGHAVSEMISSRPELRDSLKTSRRANHDGESAPITVQIAGTDAAMMAEAARHNIDRGAMIIDINMGCPAKKVCNQWAGSALMRDEPLALDIVEAVVAACAPHGVPVTLKMRTGWCDSERNALRIARAAQDAGVAMVVVHGRTREQGYKGLAEYDTVAAVKAALRIPVVANGDIDSPHKALQVLRHTGCDALMIGRAAQGTAVDLPRDRALPAARHAGGCAGHAEVRGWLLEHLQDHYALYGEHLGVRTARKHIGWAVRALPGGEAFRAAMNTLDDTASQVRAVATFFDELAQAHPQLPQAAANDASIALPHEQEAHRRVRAHQPRAVLQGPARRRAAFGARHGHSHRREADARRRDATGRGQPEQGRAVAGHQPQHLAPQAARPQADQVNLDPPWPP
jgi:tRNA-dihydrouridine synthase B